MNEVEVPVEIKKESKLKKIFKAIIKFPKIVKILLVLGIILFLYFCVTISTNLSSQSKATKFGLKDMGELVTQTSYITIVQDSQKDVEFFDLFKIPFLKSRMIFSYDFTVDASVNFEEITYETNDSKKEIVVRLPRAKHYKTSIALESQVVYLDESNLFSRIDLKEQNDALLSMQEKATETALNNKLLEAAEENAKKIITAMFKSDPKRSDYKITFEYLKVKEVIE